MRNVDQWFLNLVAARTGWRPGRFFCFASQWEDCFQISLPTEEFSPEKTDLRRCLHSAILDNNGTLTFDLPGLVAWSLSRKEEEVNSSWAINGRFPFEQSQAAKDGVFQRPFVDILIEQFCKDVIRLRDTKGLTTPKIRRPWPLGKKAAVCFTHDVDLIDGQTALWARRIFWRIKGLKSIVKGDLQVFNDVVSRLKRWKKGTGDPVWSIPKWVEEEKRLGIKSTFYFLALAFNLGPEGRRYNFRHPRLAQAVRILSEEGFEIGLHAASRQAGSLKYLKVQRERLQQISGAPITSIRNHFLNVRFPESWELMENAGFSTSSNTAWSQGKDGFRAGTCWPYKPMEIPGNKTRGNIVEIPFSLMDKARIEDVDAFVEKAMRILSQVKKAGGVFVLNFHADYFDPVEAPGVHEAYRRIATEVVADSELWIAPISKISRACFAKEPVSGLITQPFEPPYTFLKNLSSYKQAESANMRRV